VATSFVYFSQPRTDAVIGYVDDDGEGVVKDVWFST
jgi:hypothetical protein